MCTLIALHRPHPRVPLVVAANRDEYLDRPASGLAIFESGGRRIVAPRDLRAGGTWLGLNDRGMFAALTNRPNPTPDASRKIIQNSQLDKQIRDIANEEFNNRKLSIDQIQQIIAQHDSHFKKTEESLSL